jgi:glyoxylase-like metal-dependent hydrolase (beta-lactamase superfamily II)
LRRAEALVYVPGMLALGRWRLAAVEDGTYALDGGAMFGAVPRAVWAGHAAPDPENRVRLAVRCLLAIDDAARRCVLVDAGLGDGWDGARAERYAVVRGGGLDAALARHGVARDDVTDLVLTHLHFDHAAGAVRRGRAGLEAAFPRADVHLQRRQWHWALAPSDKDRASYVAEHLEALAHCGRLHLLDGGCELHEDLEIIASDGHTVGQQLPRFHGGGTHLTFCGDVIPTRAHLRVPWVMAYDLHPLTTIEEKKMLLAEALEDDGVLFFEHDPAIPACRLQEADGHPAFRERVDL